MERSDQTLNRLRQLIESQDISEGRMPPERALASELGVGRRSLRRALEVLEQEGRISRHQGRGTFVNLGADLAAVSLVAAEVGMAARSKPHMAARATIPPGPNPAFEYLL